MTSRTYNLKLKELHKQLVESLAALDRSKYEAIKEIEECVFFKHKLSLLDRLIGYKKPEVEYRKKK